MNNGSTLVFEAIIKMKQIPTAQRKALSNTPTLNHYHNFLTYKMNPIFQYENSFKSNLSLKCIYVCVCVLTNEHKVMSNLGSMI